jgi:hypothetical protein
MEPILHKNPVIPFEATFNAFFVCPLRKFQTRGAEELHSIPVSGYPLRHRPYDYISHAI